MRFVCLANSFKEGGRCVAGIELDQNNHLLSHEGHAKWVRPICNNTSHGEIPTNFVTHIHLLDILEITPTGNPTEKNYQSENFFFDKNSIRSNGKLNISDFTEHCNTRNVIFCNRGKAVSEEAVNFLDHSLMLVSANRFSLIEKTYEDHPEKLQLRLEFWYFRGHYDFPITDPVFLQNYRNNSHIIKDVEKIYLCVSLGIAHENWHYKLVAGIIY